MQVGKTGLVFGVLSNSLVGRPGGVFVGLIKECNTDIRPSFLGQTDFVGFSIDLASRQKSLQLSRLPLLARRRDVIQLTDLRQFGDAVLHYAALALQVLLLFSLFSLTLSFARALSLALALSVSPAISLDLSL